MRKLSFTSLVLVSLLFVFSCDNPSGEIFPEIQDQPNLASTPSNASKVTGFVKIEWKGKGGSGNSTDKQVFASFNAIESVFRSSNNKLIPAKGMFLYSVYKNDSTLEREVLANILEVGFSDPDTKKAWMFAEVISDTKCDPTDHSGCNDSDHSDGGCSHDDGTTDDGTAHDEGCSHDDGTTTTHDEGCSHDDSGTSHDETDTGGSCGQDHTDTGESSGGAPSDKGGKGKLCRVGQFIVVKVHDKGSPGTMDGITWKWLNDLDGFSIETEPEHLCKKIILEGNLKVHNALLKNSR